MRYLSAVLISVLVLGASIFAFDDNRKGFMVGVGGGYQSLSIGSFSDAGIATSFKIGGGITEKFSLYYVNNVSFYSDSVYGISGSSLVLLDDSTLAGAGVSGIGATYYFSDAPRSPYILGALGLSAIRYFEYSGLDEVGTGFMIGGGYAWNHVHVELTYLSATGFDNFADTSSVQFTVNYLWF